MERYEVEDIILTMADIVRENRYLRKENDRLSKIEKEYKNSIFERAKESEQASRNMLNAALVGITQEKRIQQVNYQIIFKIRILLKEREDKNI